jgi:uncharacterized membrane protein YdjX (TVP38/TMEM64 family)
MIYRVLMLVVGLAAMFILGQFARDYFQIEASPEELRVWVLSFGWLGPLAYFLLLVFRHFVFLPSSLILPVGGACLGLGLASVLGALALLISAQMEFVLFRYIRPQWLLKKVDADDQGFVAGVARSTPLFVLVATAIPPIPMTPFFFAASLTNIGFGRFTAIAALGSTIRAFVLALLGVGIFAGDLYITGAAVAAVTLMVGLTLSSPTLRSVFLQSITGSKRRKNLTDSGSGDE